MTTYGWYRFEEKYAALKRDSDWLKDLTKDTKFLYKHTDTLGEIHNILIYGKIRIEVIKRIINGTFESCNINGEISNIRYHRLNCKSADQNEDEFDNKLKGQMQQVTLIVPLTKLDVIVETKTGNNIFLVKKTEMVHYYTKPHTCIFIAQNMKYYIPETQRKKIECGLTLK